MTNPFRVGEPVHGNQFFGRERQLEKVLELLERGNAVNIYSLRRIGKTSLRNQIVYLCDHDPRWRRYRPISIDGLLVGSDLTELARYVAAELDIDPGSRDGLGAWLTVRSRLLETTGETILILDEAEILGRVPEPRSLGVLRALQQEQACGLVFLTAYRTLGEILQSVESRFSSSPLANIFLPIRLPAFASDEAEGLLTTQFQRGGRVIRPDLAKQLVAYVGAYPQLVQEIGHTAYDLCINERLTDIDATYLGAVVDKWRLQLAPWWAEMFRHALSAVDSRAGADACVAALADYGIVRRMDSGEILLSPFIADLDAYGGGRALEPEIRNVVERSRGAMDSASRDTADDIRVDVFFSYSHKDESLRDELAAHLTLLERTNVIRGWHDRRIGAGEEWRQAVDDALESARVVLLLVSADFLASDYCYDVEMRRALARHATGEAAVLPIILRACNWHSAPFAKLQVLPRDAKAITSWSNRDEAWESVAAGIEAAVRAMRNR